MLQIVESECKFTDDYSQGSVVVRSDHGNENGNFNDAFTELEAQATRRLAQNYAAQCGMAAPRINGNVSSPYPVNREGISLENVNDGNGKPLEAKHPRMQPFRYQVDVPVCAPIR